MKAKPMVFEDHQDIHQCLQIKAKCLPLDFMRDVKEHIMEAHVSMDIRSSVLL